MSYKKTFKNLLKSFIFLSLPILKRYYLVYEEGNNIILLKKGKEYNVGFILR